MSLHILIADDDPDDLFLARKALAALRTPYSLTVVEDGEEALRTLHEQAAAGTPVDLLLLDINMPRLDGLETLRRLRADPRLARLPVVMLTTSDADRDILQTFAQGATAYLTKPLRAREVATLLEKMGSPTSHGAAAPNPVEASGT